MSLSDGFRVRLADDTLVVASGALLVGGSPLTALRLGDLTRASLHGRCVTVTDDHSRRLAERLLATNLAHPDLSDLPTAAAADLTVVIPTRDRADALGHALGALAGLRCLVVDDASRAPGAVARTAEAHGATVIRLPRNLGPAGARNAGLAHVTTPYVAFVDSDVQATPDMLLALTRHFADPAVTLVGPRVVGRAMTPRPRWFERYDASASSLTLGRTPSVVRPRAAVGWLPSACLVARTGALRDDVGGFDASMRIGEDVDLVWRLVDAGHRVRYEAGLEARHATRATIRGWLGRKFVYGTGAAPLARRHGAAVAPAVLTPTYALAAAAVLLRRRWSIPVALGAVALGTRAVRRRLPPVPGRDRVAVTLAGRGMVWAVRQEASLLLRHWWPATAAALLCSKQVRRAALTAVLVDSGVAVWEHRRPADRLRPDVLLVGRRLDDLAYGAGLWWGSATAGTVGPLRPARR